MKLRIVEIFVAVGLAGWAAAADGTGARTPPGPGATARGATTRASTGAVSALSRAGGALQSRPPVKNAIDRLSFEKMRQRG